MIFDFFAEIGRPKSQEGKVLGGGYVCHSVTNSLLPICVGALVRSIYPKDYEMTDEIRKQIPKFAWPMRTEKYVVFFLIANTVVYTLV